MQVLLNSLRHLLGGSRVPVARRHDKADEDPLYLDPASFSILFRELGPSLGLWRAAEVAALRTCDYARPVLDVGCGDGLVTSLVMKRVDIGCDPFGEAAGRAAGSGLYERIERRPVEAAHLPDGGLRTVLCNSVLEHVSSPDTVLRAISRTLAPGGRLVFTAPTAEFGKWLALPSSRYAAWRNRRLVHLNLLTAREWADRLVRFGLHVASVRPYLRRALVAVWDAIDLAEQIRVAGRRPAGLVWRGLPAGLHMRIARLASRMDLSSGPPGGGHLIIAVRRP